MAMKSADHDEIYDGDYYAFVDQSARTAAPVMAGTLIERFAPASLVDFGCGSGAFLAEVQARGVKCIGVDNSQHAVDLCRSRGLEVHPCDLRAPDVGALSSRYDLATSFEVAEHLPASLADAFVALLCRFSARVAITAAPPGQGGTNHINEQPPEYWIAKFNALGYRFDAQASGELRKLWERGGTASWYHQNLLVFHAADTAIKSR